MSQKKPPEPAETPEQIEEKIRELKAQAYDMIALIQKAETELKRANEQIAAWQVKLQKLKATEEK
jgi:hypothetical protein